MANPGQKKAAKVSFAAGCILVVALVVACVIFFVTREEDEDNEVSPAEVARRALESMPVIDGHNDFPWNLRQYIHNDLRLVNFTDDLRGKYPWNTTRSHTDIPRLLQGKVGAQFWVAYTTCGTQYKDAVEQTIEQIDVIHRLVNKYSDHLQWASSADEIEAAIANKKIASLIGVEGGHSIQSSFGILRNLYAMGTRYMTLTHNCNTPWADNNLYESEYPGSEGLSPFGLRIIEEMNRLGMMIDLSHVAASTMRAAIRNSRAPVIFSHSCARALCDHTRNVPDDVLQLVKDTNSLVMINFYTAFVKCPDSSPPTATVDDVAQHIDYIRNVAGADFVGIGGDYDGVTSVPIGLEDVSKYPTLFEKLAGPPYNWTQPDLEKLSGRNLLRVFRAVEKVRDDMESELKQAQEGSPSIEEQNKMNLSCITASFPTRSGKDASVLTESSLDHPEL